MLAKLQQLQQEIYRYTTAEDKTYFPGYSPKLSFYQVGELFDISFYGDGYDDDPNTLMSEISDGYNFAFCRLLDVLTSQEYADQLVSISFEGPDEGANGTKSWDFTRLTNSGVNFPELKSFKVKLTDPGDHNLNIIEGSGEEGEEMIAKLISKMPVLEELVLPSTPGISFFEIGEHPLKHLTLQAGYGHQHFIENLANSSNFKGLKSLDYSDMMDLYDLPEDEFTPFHSYAALFVSTALLPVKHLKLRNTKLSQEQLFELQKLNDIQFLYIDVHGGRYVSHMMRQP